MPCNEEAARERAAVLSFVRSFRLSAADAEDVTQDTLLAAAQSGGPRWVPEGRTPEQARDAWIRGVATRKVAQHLRELSQRYAAPHTAAGHSQHVRFADAHAPSPEDLLLSIADFVLLDEALAALERWTPAGHNVVVAHELDGLSIRAAAQAFGIPVNTTWNYLRKGKQGLRVFARRLRARREARRPDVVRPVADGRPETPCQAR